MSAIGEWGGVALDGTWCHGVCKQHSYPERDNKHTADKMNRWDLAGLSWDNSKSHGTWEN